MHKLLLIHNQESEGRAEFAEPLAGRARPILRLCASQEALTSSPPLPTAERAHRVRGWCHTAVSCEPGPAIGLLTPRHYSGRSYTQLASSSSIQTHHKTNCIKNKGDKGSGLITM